jgi:HD superfamily phosphodiesterase
VTGDNAFPGNTIANADEITAVVAIVAFIMFLIMKLLYNINLKK